MRLSKHLYFFVAAAIASAIHGAPIGDVLQRRQEILLELAPSQKVSVDGDREVPTIVISEQGLPIAYSNNAGMQSGSYSIEMPPVGFTEDLKVPQTSYNPYSKTYSPYAAYPPSRVVSPPTPLQSLPLIQSSPPRTLNVATPPAGPLTAEFGPIANWDAPLISSGSFDTMLHGAVLGSPTMPGTFIPSTTATAPPPAPAPPPVLSNTTSTSEQVPPVVPAPAPLPGLPPIASPPPSTPSAPPSLPAPVPHAPPTEEKKTNDVTKPSPGPGPVPAPAPAPAPPTTPSKNDVHTITNEAAVAKKDHSDAEVTALPHQRRSARAGVQNPSSAPEKMSKAGPSRLRKRQLDFDDNGSSSPDEPASKCAEQTVVKFEVLVPVTEAELAQLQDGTVQLVSYVVDKPDGGVQSVYDVVPVDKSDVGSNALLKQVLEKGAAKMFPSAKQSVEDDDTGEEENESESSQGDVPSSNRSGGASRTIVARSFHGDDRPNMKLIPSKNLLQELHKRLKHGSNAFNASMVGNGAGMTKYGYTIHHNTNGSYASSPLGVLTTLSLAALFGVWATLL